MLLALPTGTRQALLGSPVIAALSFKMDIEELNKNAKSLVDETWKDSSKWHQNFEKAKGMLEAALDIAPNDEVTLINYGTVLCDMGSHKVATEYLRKAIDQGSENKHACLLYTSDAADD